VNVLQNVAWIVAILGGSTRCSPAGEQGHARPARVLPPLPGTDPRYVMLLTQRYPSFSDDDPRGSAVVDYHTGGEPFRIVDGGVPPLEGRRSSSGGASRASTRDRVRRLLVFEPAGTPTCTAATSCRRTTTGRPRRRLLPQRGLLDRLRPRHDRARHLGARRGRRRAREGENRVVVDVPSGRLETWATVEGGRVRSVRFETCRPSSGPRASRPPAAWST
jgi:hypothetical protein